MTDGTGAPGPYSQTPYKLVTTDIESVDDLKNILTYSAGNLTGNGYSETGGQTQEQLRQYLNTYAATNGSLWDLATNVQEGISPDLRPDPAIVWNGSSQVIYKFSLPSVVTFSRSTAWTGAADWYLMGSDDGVTWYSAAQTISGIPGPYPDETYPRAYADRPYTYYIFSYTWGQGGSTSDGYFLDAANTLESTDVLLTFPGAVSTNPDLQYFQAGDVVQGKQLTGKVQWTGQYEASWNTPGVNQQAPYTVGVRFTPKTTDAADGKHPWTMIKLDSPITQGLKYDLNMDGYWVGNANQFELFASNDGVTWIEKGSSTLPATIGAGESWQYFAVYNGTQGDSRSDELNSYFYSWFFDPGEEYRVISTGYPDSNTMVVDGGEWIGSDGSGTDGVNLGWNQDEVWSATTTNNGRGAPYNPPAAFDGNITSTFCASTNNGEIVFTPPTPLSGKLEINGNNQPGPSEFNELTVTSIENNVSAVQIPPREWYDCGQQTNITEIKLNSTTASGGAVLFGIKLNGQLLVDTGIAGAPTPAGDTSVSYQTNGGQGTIISTDPATNTLLISDTGDRDNRWIAENKADTDFYVAGPSVVDEPLLTTNVELQSSEFSTTPEGVDGLKEIIWNLNGVDQPGTTLNPYKPSGLALNTTYNVKVKHVGNALKEPSEWSATTTFATGASRSLKEHYVKQIRELEQQLAAAQGTKTRSVDTDEPKRARNADGTYRGDDPSTPDVNEAWEGGEEPPTKGKRGRK